MKKILIILILSAKTFSAKSDVIYFPYQYALFCYSAEFINSFEKINNLRNTTDSWFGAGCVGSFFYLDKPALGFETAIEKRHYFQPEKYKNFFISAYIGAAYVSNFNDISSIGIIPGLKINYKAQLSPKAVLEPYLSLSLPLSIDLESSSRNPIFPVLTVGVRFGLNELINDIKSGS